MKYSAPSPTPSRPSRHRSGAVPHPGYPKAVPSPSRRYYEHNFCWNHVAGGSKGRGRHCAGALSAPGARTGNTSGSNVWILCFSYITSACLSSVPRIEQTKLAHCTKLLVPRSSKTSCPTPLPTSSSDASEQSLRSRHRLQRREARESVLLASGVNEIFLGQPSVQLDILLSSANLPTAPIRHTQVHAHP